MKPTKSDPHRPSLQLLAKIGAVVVHVDELFSPDGRNIDKEAIMPLLADPEVRQWVKDMGALLPLKRRS